MGGLKSPIDDGTGSNINAGYNHEDPEMDELARKVYGKFQEAKSYRKNWDKDWDRYYLYWAGRQNHGKLAWRTDATVNMVWPVIESIVAHMTDSNPKITVLPQEKAYVRSASLMEQVMERTWIDNRMVGKLTNICRDALIYGTSFAKCYYDRRTNLVTIDELDVRKIFPSPGATNMQDANYVIYCDNVHKSIVESKFPKYKGKIPGGTWDSELTFMKNVTSSRGGGGLPGIGTVEGQFPGINSKSGGQGANQDKDHVTYIEYWHRDPEDWNSILVTIAVNGLILSHRKNPFNHNRFPFVKFIDYGVTNIFWGLGEVQQIEKPQDSINMRRGQIIDILRLTANPPFIKSHNSGISNKTIPNVPGIMLTVNAGAEARWMQTPQVNEGLFRLNEMDKREIEEITGISEITQGRRPKGITAAQAIEAVSEAGQTRIRPKIRNMEDSLTELGELLLSNIQQFYTDEKQIRLAGKTKEFISINVPKVGENGEVTLDNDLSVGKYDVKIGVGSLTDVTKATKYETMKELKQLLPELIDAQALLETVPGLSPEEVEAILGRAKEMAAAVPEEGVAPEGEMPPEEMGAAPGAAPGGIDLSAIAQQIGALEGSI